MSLLKSLDGIFTALEDLGEVIKFSVVNEGFEFLTPTNITHYTSITRIDQE